MTCFTKNLFPLLVLIFILMSLVRREDSAIDGELIFRSIAFSFFFH